LFSGGCTDGRRADYSQLQLVEVSGQVSLDGQSLVQATIIFETDDRDFSNCRIERRDSIKIYVGLLRAAFCCENRKELGWRYSPSAKGKPPFCTCKLCTRGEYGARQLRERRGE